MVKSSSTFAQTTLEKDVSHSSWDLHPTQPHPRTKYLGEAGIGYSIPTVVWITPIAKMIVIYTIQGHVLVIVRKESSRRLVVIDQVVHII